MFFKLHIIPSFQSILGQALIPGRAKRHLGHFPPHRKDAFLFSEKTSSSFSAQLQAQADDGYETALQKFVVKANTMSLLSFINVNVAAP